MTQPTDQDNHKGETQGKKGRPKFREVVPDISIGMDRFQRGNFHFQDQDRNSDGEDPIAEHF